jgi:hypothetical protein
VVNSARRKGAGSSNQTMDVVTFFQKKLGKVRAVLTCDAGDKSGFRHG